MQLNLQSNSSYTNIENPSIDDTTAKMKEDEWDLFNNSLQMFNPLLKNINKKQNFTNKKISQSSQSSQSNKNNRIKKRGIKEDITKDIDLSVKLNIKNIKRDYKKCPKCGIYCKISNNLIICELCGLERPWDENDKFSITYTQNYNTSSNSFMVFNIIGQNSYCYQRSFLKTCANYSSYRNNNNKKEIINKIYQYSGNKIPINICNLTAELFDQIKQKGYVYRGNGKWGVIGACLFYACIMHNLTRTPREIANIIGIEDRFLSQGDKILQELNELGIISIPTTFKPLGDYIDQFFSALNISMKYKQFIIDLISTAERKYLHIGNESRMTTKCIGCIYLLTRRIPALKKIKKCKISKECIKISKSTFIRYYNLLMDNPKVIKKVFKKHHIPMPVEWKGL